MREKKLGKIKLKNQMWGARSGSKGENNDQKWL